MPCTEQYYENVKYTLRNMDTEEEKAFFSENKYFIETTIQILTTRIYQLTEKRKEQFDRARLKRSEYAAARHEEKRKQQEEFDRKKPS